MVTATRIAGWAADRAAADRRLTVELLADGAMLALIEHPEARRQLTADPSMMVPAVEELLRWEAPAQYLVRYTLKDAELHGRTIPAGNAVMICVGAANRDERAFPDAETFDITRDRSAAQNLGLGYGEHSCLGAALARMECIAAIDRMLDFMPRYEIRRDGLKRVAMSNVIGWHNVPVRVLR